VAALLDRGELGHRVPLLRLLLQHAQPALEVVVVGQDLSGVVAERLAEVPQGGDELRGVGDDAAEDDEAVLVEEPAAAPPEEAPAMPFELVEETGPDTEPIPPAVVEAPVTEPFLPIVGEEPEPVAEEPATPFLVEAEAIGDEPVAMEEPAAEEQPAEADAPAADSGEESGEGESNPSTPEDSKD